MPTRSSKHGIQFGVGIGLLLAQGDGRVARNDVGDTIGGMRINAQVSRTVRSGTPVE